MACSQMDKTPAALRPYAVTARDEPRRESESFEVSRRDDGRKANVKDSPWLQSKREHDGVLTRGLATK